MNLASFNHGDYVGALADRSRVEAISRVLYSGDGIDGGRKLRPHQQFFFVSASLQDLIARHLSADLSLYALPEKAAIQMNDTHPAIAVAELMRLLVDVHGIKWSEA